MALKARDDAFFAANPITGQFLREPAVIHQGGPIPDKYKSDLRSWEEHKDGPGLSQKGVLKYFGACPWSLSLCGRLRANGNTRIVRSPADGPTLCCSPRPLPCWPSAGVYPGQRDRPYSRRRNCLRKGVARGRRPYQVRLVRDRIYVASTCL